MTRIEASPICEERFSLREFCHLNDNGFYALNYTEYLVEQVETDPALWHLSHLSQVQRENTPNKQQTPKFCYILLLFFRVFTIFCLHSRLLQSLFFSCGAKRRLREWERRSCGCKCARRLRPTWSLIAGPSQVETLEMIQIWSWKMNWKWLRYT